MSEKSNKFSNGKKEIKKGRERKEKDQLLAADRIRRYKYFSTSNDLLKQWKCVCMKGLLISFIYHARKNFGVRHAFQSMLSLG